MQTVKVCFRVQDGKRSEAPCVIQRITGLYMDGRVRTSTGDTFEIKPHAGRDADFIAVK